MEIPEIQEGKSKERFFGREYERSTVDRGILEEGRCSITTYDKGKEEAKEEEGQGMKSCPQSMKEGEETTMLQRTWKTPKTESRIQ